MLLYAWMQTRKARLYYVEVDIRTYYVYREVWIIDIKKKPMISTSLTFCTQSRT